MFHTHHVKLPEYAQSWNLHREEESRLWALIVVDGEELFANAEARLGNAFFSDSAWKCFLLRFLRTL